MTYKISIITANFNMIKNGREAFFRQMVESVQMQSYKNIEHWVVDGGSKDGSKDILQDYADRGLIKFISEPDKGIYDAMNKGAKLASGDLITFLNTDDFFHNPKGLEEAVKVFNEGFDYSYAPVRVLDIESGECKLGRLKLQRLLRNMPFPHPGMLVKKNVFEKLGGFDDSFKLAADYDFILRAMLGGYRGHESDVDFVTFRSGGASDVFADKQLPEKAAIYYKNYGELAGLSKEDCQKMAETYVFPKKLLAKLLWGEYQTQVKLSALWVGMNSLKRILFNNNRKK